jgi:triosephosphate isomerase (TIM)
MSGRVPLLAGNWKMHGSPSEARKLASAIRDLVSDVTGRDVVLAPAFPALAAVAECVRGTRIAVAGQNLHWEDKGAFTGEVSAPMLADAGCSFVIIGHSERRQYFGETDELVARRVAAAFRHDLVPIVCIGETLEQREAGAFLEVIDRQLRAGLGGFDAAQIGRIVVAYEPVWAIGTGKVATPEQAQEVHAEIRRVVGDLASGAVAAALRILYGGSVKPDNIDDLMRQPDLDGALVGGASLKAEDFAHIVRFHP